MSLPSKLESILFVASKPLTIKQLAAATGEEKHHIEEALETLIMKYNRDDSGIHILHEAETVQMSTNAANREVVDGFIKDDVTGELTKAQLETLTVVAYRSPVTRAELEQIRGVNCAVILRNLMMRGLVEEYMGSDDILPTYTMTMQALAALGINSVQELPEYDTLRSHEHIAHTLDEQS